MRPLVWVTQQSRRKKGPSESNPSYGYQLYQAQRPRTHAEILAGDEQLGRQAAAASRGSRALAGKAGTQGSTA